MTGAWLVLLACAREPASPAPTAASVQDPTVHVQALRVALGGAQAAWSDGRREEAQELVATAYRDHFEPLEPALRARDPMGTLELEYAFGSLAARMGRVGTPAGLAAEVRGLTEAVEAAWGAMPVEAAE